MSAPASTLDRSERPQEAIHLQELLARLRENLEALQSSEADEGQLRVDLEALPVEVEAFGKDFKEHVTACLDIRKQVDSAPARKRFFARLDKDSDAGAAAKRSVLGGKSKLKVAETIVDSLFKITSARNVFDLVETKEVRKIIPKALSRVTVSVGKISQGIEELATTIVFFETNNLYAKLQELPDAPPEAAPENPEGEAKKKDETAQDETARDGTAAPPSQEPVEPPAPVQARDASTVVRKKDSQEPRETAALRAEVEADQARKNHCLSSREFRRVQATLNRRSRWHPFIPSAVGSAVGILQAEEEAAVRVLADAWWSRDKKKKDNKHPTENAAETDPQVRERLEDIEYVGRFPADLLVVAEGEPLFTNSFKANGTSNNPAAASVKAASEWMSENYLQRVVEPFCARPAVRKDKKGNKRSFRRLSRVKLELSKIPILRLRCGFKNPSHPKVGAEFVVWVYGKEQRVLWESLPKQWTWKANAWLATFVMLGIPFGWLLAKLL